MLRKKSLGQHFLHSTHYVRMVADAAGIQKGDIVLEVGPGEGALTKELLSLGATVVVIEKDARLIPVLNETFAEAIQHKKLFVHEADALEFDTSKVLPTKKPYKVVANIPYYITGALLREFLTAKVQPSTLVFLVQKEVAERIAKSNPDANRSGPRPKRRGKESILSLSVKAYGTPAYIKTVPRGAFVPPPTVDSAILAISNISRKNFKNAAMEEKFFALIKAGFAQKRKLLKSNLAVVLGKDTLTTMQRAGIPESARAEDVAITQWLSLSKLDRLS